MGVTYGEVHGYPKSRWVNGEFFGVRRVRCAWADRVSLMDELDGDSWPYADGVSNAIAREAIINPLPAQLTADGNKASYEYAIVTIKYSTVGPQLNGSDWIEESVSPYVVTQRLDYEALEWTDGTALAYLESPGKILYGLQYMLKFYNVSVIPSSVLSRVGYVNSNSVNSYSLGMTFYPGRLLYGGALLTRRVSWGGSWNWDVTYYFKYHPHNWNYFWRTETNQYETVKITSSGDTFQPYPTTMF